MEKYKEKRKTIQITEKGIWGTKCTTIPEFRTIKPFITEDEYRLYRCLEAIYKKNKDVKIFVQVALNRIIESNDRRYYEDTPEESVMNKFKGISIDFALYSKKEQKIFCCIELNGKEHHNDPKRIERDIFLTETFELLEIPIIMIESRKEEKNKLYEQDEIKNKINNEIEKKANIKIETTTKFTN